LLLPPHSLHTNAVLGLAMQNSSQWLIAVPREIALAGTKKPATGSAAG